MVTRFLEKYYQLQITTEGILGGQHNTFYSITIYREYIETGIKNYSDSDRREKRLCIPLTLNNIISIIHSKP